MTRLERLRIQEAERHNKNMTPLERVLFEEASKKNDKIVKIALVILWIVILLTINYKIGNINQIWNDDPDKNWWNDIIWLDDPDKNWWNKIILNIYQIWNDDPDKNWWNDIIGNDDPDKNWWNKIKWNIYQIGIDDPDKSWWHYISCTILNIFKTIWELIWMVVWKCLMMTLNLTQEEINEQCVQLFKEEILNQFQLKKETQTIALIRPHTRNVEREGLFSPERFGRDFDKDGKSVGSAFKGLWQEDAKVDAYKIDSYIVKKQLQKCERDKRMARLTFDYVVYNITKKKWNDIIAEGYICIDIDKEPLMFAILQPIRMTKVVMMWIQACLEADQQQKWPIVSYFGDNVTWQVILYQKVTGLLFETWLPHARFDYNHDFECQPTEGAYFFSVKFEPIDVQLIERSTNALELPIRDFMRYLTLYAKDALTEISMHYVQGNDWWGLKKVEDAYPFHKVMNYSLFEFEVNNDWNYRYKAQKLYYAKKIWLSRFEIPKTAIERRAWVALIGIPESWIEKLGILDFIEDVSRCVKHNYAGDKEAWLKRVITYFNQEYDWNIRYLTDKEMEQKDKVDYFNQEYDFNQRYIDIKHVKRFRHLINEHYHSRNEIYEKRIWEDYYQNKYFTYDEYLKHLKDK